MREMAVNGDAPRPGRGGRPAMKPKALFKVIIAAIFVTAFQYVAAVRAPLFAADKVPAIPGASVKTTLIIPEIYRKGTFRTGHTLMAPPGFRVSVFAAG